MAEEPAPIENLILVTSIERPDYISVKLIPKTNAEWAAKRMAEPTHYTSLFSMSRARPLEGYKLPGAYGLLGVTSRAPYMFHENFESRLRVMWLGKDESTITGEFDQLVEMMLQVKGDSINKRFNLPAVRIDRVDRVEPKESSS
jgi:hypothetical protein